MYVKKQNGEVFEYFLLMLLYTSTPLHLFDIFSYFKMKIFENKTHEMLIEYAELLSIKRLVDWQKTKGQTKITKNVFRLK